MVKYFTFMLTSTTALEANLRKVSEEISAVLGGIDPEVFDFKKFPFSFMGKASRARFTLLAAGALGLEGAKAARIAAAAELTHTASLLHDDCLDLARYRRGLPTMNDQLGVNAAILVGDLVVALAFDCAGRAAPELSAELVLTVKRMTEGALIEENSRGKKISAAQAERIVTLKTGALFRWCGLAACAMARRPELLETCALIGERAGAAFQVIDDVLDFEGDAGACGKETLKDIKEGKFTLPLILALNDAAAGPAAEKLAAAMKSGPAADLSPALELADLVNKGGFAAAARRTAIENLKGLSPLLEKLPSREGAELLRFFLAALGERRA